MKDMIIRNASVDDAEALLNIYAYYVKNTAITFEYEVPSLEEFKERITNTLKKYPYLVAEKEDKIVGYAYAGSFHTREAYQHAAELSVYVRQDWRGHGIGSSLYRELEK
ncbi:MAG: N-acetyltransferase, partial [Lachnospiraceae bacterium]|nr:N-acetyltransferase [Lachnospiraceae bacterium]